MPRVTSLLALLLLSLGVACAPSVQEVAPSSGEGATLPKDVPTALTPTASQPKHGGMMVITPAESVKTMDPYFSAGAAMNHVGRPVYQALTGDRQPTMDTDPRGAGEVEPALAERWEMPNDKTILYYLRKGVKFHNGDDLTADDVLFSFDYARDPKNNFIARTSFRTVEAIEKLDQFTVKVTLKELDPDILSRLSGQYILSKKFYSSGGDFKATAIGTGPFRQIRFEPDKESLSVRNDSYWDKGKPYLDGLRHIFGLERSAVQAAFVTKKVDYYIVTDKVQFEEYRKLAPDLKYFLFYSDTNDGWYPNLTRPPLNDQRVRKAIQLVLDRQAMNESATFGLGRIHAPGDAGFLKEAGLSQEQLMKLPGWRQPKEPDIAEAQRLMREAGFSSGLKLRAVFVNTTPTVPLLAELSANQLRSALNITLELVGVDTQIWSDLVNNKGDFDLAMGSNTRIRSEPDAALTNYWYSKGTFNRGINDPELDALILKQKTILDGKERKKVWAEISRIITDREYYLSTIDLAYFGMTQPWVHNVYPSYTVQPWLRKAGEIWLDTDSMPQDRLKAPR